MINMGHWSSQTIISPHFLPITGWRWWFISLLWCWRDMYKCVEHIFIIFSCILHHLCMSKLYLCETHKYYIKGFSFCKIYDNTRGFLYKMQNRSLSEDHCLPSWVIPFTLLFHVHNYWFLLVILKDFSMVGLPIVVLMCRLTQSTDFPWRQEHATNYSGVQVFCLML